MPHQYPAQRCVQRTRHSRHRLHRPRNGLVDMQAGDMIGKIALSIERGADVVDNGKTIHLLPKLGERIGMAEEVAQGSCTDVPPSKR